MIIGTGIACFAAAAAVAQPLQADAGSGISATVYRSSKDRPFREVRDDVPFSALWRAAGTPVLDLDAARPSHKFLGLGVSFAESGAKLLAEMPAERRERIMRMLWTKEGINLTVGRIHVGCSDYSAHMYTYADVPGDMELRHFSIDPDRRYVLPFIKEAAKLQPQLFCFSSVWTPPAWMKLNRELCGGWISRRHLPVFCDYYVKFLLAYRDEGIDIRALTVQNEPYSDQDGQSADCKWGPEEEMDVVGRLLPPRLKAAGLSTQIWLRDSEPDEWQQTLWELDDPDVRANVAGIAWHSYGSNPDNMRKVSAKHPGIPMYHTEMGPHLEYEKRSLVWWGSLVARFLNAGCGTFVSWCPVLDEEGGPNLSRGFRCAGLVEVHSETGAVTPSNQYKLFRHIGPYVERGADVLSAPEGRSVVAFRNPDGSHVIVAAVESAPRDRKMQLQVKLGGMYRSFQLPVGTVSTIILRRRAD